MIRKVSSFAIVLAIIVPIILPNISILSNNSSVTLNSTNTDVTITLTIIDANYADADADGFEDDVIGFFDISLSGSNRYNLNVYPVLILPSGTTYSYAYVVNTRLSLLHCTMYFFDHAIESGWYTFSVEIVLFNGGITSGTADYEFDPPGGGKGDTDPCGELVVS